MANINEMFKKSINEANKNILSITDPYKKAMANISLAQALATTGFVGNDTESVDKNMMTNIVPAQNSTNDDLIDNNSNTESIDKNKETEKTNDKNKQSLKRNSAKTKSNAVKTDSDEKQKETIDETATDIKLNKKEESVELTEEWTDEAIALLTEELEFIQVKQNEYTEDVLNDCVVQYSNGLLKEISELNPLTIKGFVDYIRQCESEANEE